MRILQVTNMQQMSDVLGISLNGVNNTTDLEDVDDDIGNVSLDVSTAITPKLPHRDFNIATLTQDKLEELKKSSK